MSLLCQLGSTLAVPKLWLLCKLSPKVAVPQRRASVAATAAPATAAPYLFSHSPAGSEAEGVTSAEVLLWQGQVSGEFARMDGDVIRLESTMDQLLASVETS